MSDRTHFTVMTMNLRFGLSDDGDNSWPNRKHLFSKIFHKYPATFIGMQESNHFQTEFLNQILDEHNFIGWHNRSCETWQNNILFYHKSWHCLENLHFFLSETPEVESKLSGSRWPRQCVIGLFEKDDFRIIVINTHFDFDGLVQKRSSELIMGFLSYFSQKYPVVITGDFNTIPGSPPYNIFMDNGFCEVFDNEYISTFHGFTGEEGGDHIDWILYRGNLHLTCKKVIKDSFSGRFPSDHYPVLARFDYDNL